MYMKFYFNTMYVKWINPFHPSLDSLIVLIFPPFYWIHCGFTGFRCTVPQNIICTLYCLHQPQPSLLPLSLMPPIPSSNSSHHPLIVLIFEKIHIVVPKNPFIFYFPSFSAINTALQWHWFTTVPWTYLYWPSSVNCFSLWNSCLSVFSSTVAEIQNFEPRWGGFKFYMHHLLAM